MAVLIDTHTRVICQGLTDGTGQVVMAVKS